MNNESKSIDTIETNIKTIKKYILKNYYVLGFSVLALILFLIFLITSLNIEKINNSIFFQFFVILPSGFWIFLIIMFIFSAILAYYEKYSLMFLPIIFWLLFTTTFVRTQNIPQLKDITTGDYTLGPDLDPFLYLRHAQEINEGRLQNLDTMRRAPLGIENYALTNMMPWAMFFIYKIISIFKETSITYAAILTPVVFSVLASFFFFLFVYVLFSFKFSKGKSFLGATIATAFYVFSVQMLHRTTAGIPEIESLGMVWFWLAFLFFALAWKQDITKDKAKVIIFSILSGLFTGAMSWTWGGYKYIYMIITFSALLAFIFDVEKKKNTRIFVLWALASLVIGILKWKNPLTLASSFIDTGFALAFLFVIFIDKILEKEKIKKFQIIKKINLPSSLKSILISFFVLIILLAILKPEFLFNTFSYLIERFLYPFGRQRLELTVAENAAPYLNELIQNFGFLFWFFLLGTIFAFYGATKKFKLKLKFILNFFFILFLASFTFSRISSQHLLNGENFISKFLYFGGLILFGIILIYTYSKAYKNKDEDTLNNFKNIGFIYLLMISFSFFAIISFRGAIRLFFMIAPFLIILSSYLTIETLNYTSKSKDSTSRFFLWIFLIFVILALMNTFSVQAISTIQSAKATAPSIYNQQWQKAMAWVRDNTSEDSIFVHWWDYGYWIQSIGKRPTVTDGGHAGGNSAIHFIGRYVLTTPKPETALSFMKTWNVSYLLIDSTDLGKYPAYSKIGSDENWDRMSVIQVMVSDRSQIRESANSTIMVYQGGSGVDEDIVYENNETEIFLPGPTYDKVGSPSYKSFAIGAIIELPQNSLDLKQPEVVYVYNNKQYRIPIRYVYFNKELIDFKSGINAALVLIPSVFQNSQGSFQIDPLGAAIYLSNKTMNTLFAQLYLMDDPLNRYPTVKLMHAEDDPFVESLKSQVPDAGEFLYFQGFRGPIKIWKIEYDEKIPVYQEFQKFDYTFAGLDSYFN